MFREPPKRKSLKARLVLSALLVALSLTSCAANRFSRPDKSRTATEAYPTIPDGAAPCPKAPDARCLSDSQNADLLRAYDAALTRANDKLEWLGDYLAGGFE